jgi:hypothetical protein
MKISETKEAELRVQTQMMYNKGGIDSVLGCISEMQQCQIVILIKLNEILDQQIKSEEA